MKDNKMEIALMMASRRKDIVERLKQVLIDKLMLPVEPDELSEDSTFFGLGLALDSVDALEIVVSVEDEFNVTITDEDMAVFSSFNSTVDFIIKKQKEK